MQIVGKIYSIPTDYGAKLSQKKETKKKLTHSVGQIAEGVLAHHRQLLDCFLPNQEAVER